MRGMEQSSKSVAALLALGGVWGASFLFIKVIVDEVSPLELVAGRLLLGALTIVLFTRFRRLPLRVSPALVGQAAVLAAVNNIVPFSLIAIGEQHIDSGTASVLNSTMPIFTAAFAAAFLADEHFTAARAGGLALGFLGVAVLAGNGVRHITDADMLGQLAVVAAAACYGLGATYARSVLRTNDPIGLSAVQLTMGTLMAIPLVFIFHGLPHQSLSLKAALSLLTLGVVGTGFAYIVYLWLIDVTGSVRASLVTYIIPAVGLFLGWAVLNEHIGVSTAAGSALIVAGVAIVMRGRSPARMPSPAAEAVAAE